MPDSAEAQKFARLLETLAPGTQLLHIHPLAGGVSARVTALNLRTPTGDFQTWVARQHGPRDLAKNPHIAEDEFRLLKILHTAGIPVPAPLHLAPAGEFSSPTLLEAFIEGQTEFAPAHLDHFLTQLATHLAQLHRLDPAPFAFLPRHISIPPPPPTLDDTLSESQIRAILATHPLPEPPIPVLLHGDYWPGNLLWHAGHLTAILDWEDAARGHPLADISNTRLEILWAFGHEAMEAFTRLYHTYNSLDLSPLPLWDLCAALRPAGKLSTWGLDPETEKMMREKHQGFVNQALFLRSPNNLSN